MSLPQRKVSRNSYFYFAISKNWNSEYMLKINKTITQQQAMQSQNQQPSTADREFQLTINDNGVNLIRKGVSVVIDTSNNISINGAQVILGTSAIDPLVGGVVTNLTYPFDFVTGAPIPASVKVKASS